MQPTSKNACWQSGSAALRHLPSYTAFAEPTSTSPTLTAAHKLLTLHPTLLFCTGVHLAADDAATSLGSYLAALAWGSGAKRVYVALPSSRAVESSCVRISSSRNIPLHRIGLDFLGRSLPSGDLISSSLSLVFFTYSTLLSALRKNPTLSTASLIIVSEDNSTDSHILLALLRLAQRSRPMLRLAVCVSSSGIANTSTLSGVPRLHSPIYRPTQTRFTAVPVPDALSAAVSAVSDAHIKWRRDGTPHGAHMLVFSPDASTAREIAQAIDAWARLRAKTTTGRHKRSSDTRRALRAALVGPGLDNVGGLDDGSDGAQIVFVTGCARSSTIAGSVRAQTIIDCGLSESRVYASKEREFRIGLAPISRAEADLRAQFACDGDGSGLCLRLYTELFYKEQMAALCAPDILTDELSRALLDLKSFGVDDVSNFAYITTATPRTPHIATALERLYNLGALSATGTLTESGRTFAELPFADVAMARCVSMAGKLGVHDEVLAIACVLHESTGGSRALFHKPASRANFAAEEGDLVTTLNVFRRYCAANRSTDWCRAHNVAVGPLKRAHGLFRALQARFPSAESEMSNILGRNVGERVCRALAEGYFIQAARRSDDGEDGQNAWYITSNSSVRAQIHPSSVVHGAAPEWIVYAKCVKTGARYLREVTVVRDTWLPEIAPRLFLKHGEL